MSKGHVAVGRKAKEFILLLRVGCRLPLITETTQTENRSPIQGSMILIVFLIPGPHSPG